MSTPRNNPRNSGNSGGRPARKATHRKGKGAVAQAVNPLTVFIVVRADSHEAAARLFDGHPHMTIFPCDGVEVMPVLG